MDLITQFQKTCQSLFNGQELSFGGFTIEGRRIYYKGETWGFKYEDQDKILISYFRINDPVLAFQYLEHGVFVYPHTLKSLPWT